MARGRRRKIKRVRIDGAKEAGRGRREEGRTKKTACDGTEK